MMGKLASARMAAAPMMLSMMLLSVVLLTHVGTARAAAYKWVDERGVVHYSDQIPPEAVNRGSVIIDKQGRSVQKIEPALTQEQLREKRLEDERMRAQQQKQEEQGRRDRALLSSYSSEDEIDLARNRAISTVDSQLRSAQGYTVELSNRHKLLEARKLEFGNKPVPAALEIELAGIDDELTRQNVLIAQKRIEITSIASRYELEKQRWRELRTQDFVPTPLPSVEAAKSAPGTNGSKKTSAANK